MKGGTKSPLVFKAITIVNNDPLSVEVNKGICC